MESAVSFAPLCPAGFVNFTGRGGARPAFCGAGRGGAACSWLGCVKEANNNLDILLNVCLVSE